MKNEILSSDPKLILDDLEYRHNVIEITLKIEKYYTSISSLIANESSTIGHIETNFIQKRGLLKNESKRKCCNSFYFTKNTKGVG